MGTDPKESQVVLELQPKETESERRDEPPKTPGKTLPMLPALPVGKICTIGYTKISAEAFFKLLSDADVKVLIDVRANASYGISGYTFRRDFEYFCKLHGIELAVLEILAPSSEIRKAYQGSSNWGKYEESFIKLLNQRKVFANPEVRKTLFESGSDGAICFLCSEPTADKCHRRLVAEHLLKFLPNASEIKVVHLQGSC